MITGEGGFVHRLMPPVDWDCGSIPEECYNPSLTKCDIENILTPIYLAEDRIRRLADSDDEWELLRAKIALEILVEIDADMIWCHNLVCKSG
jgi:hypothetical protein